MRGDECAQACKHIPPAGNSGITLCGGGIAETGNHHAPTGSCIWLKGAPRIPNNKIGSDRGHSQMDARNRIKILNVWSAMQDFAFDADPTVLRKVAELGAVAD